MNNLADDIISVFLTKQAHVLKDTELSTILASQGIPCLSSDIRRHVQLLSPALFQSTSNPDGTLAIRLDPKLEICEDFLGSRCRTEAKTCDKLHICRHFEGSCPTPNCRFPHNFNQGYNRKLIAQNNCQYINPVLLIKLLRQSKSLSIHASTRKPRGKGARGGRGRNRGGRGRGRGRNFAHQISTRSKNDPNRQLDVSFPSSILAPQLDMEIIEMILERDDVDKLLEIPVINHDGVAIKFKRTNHIIDKRSFLLKTAIANESEKITEPRFALYISTLVGKGVQSHTQDLSSDNEQIILVKCDNDLDLTQVRQAHESRPQLYGKHIALVQIYECDTLEIHYNEDNKSITNTDLQAIFRSAWNDIFAYNFPTDDCAEVEFISVNAFKQWMSTSEFTENKFDITISPIIDNVDENNVARSVIEQPSPININTCSTTTHAFGDRTHQTKIKLRSEWALIVAHSKFQLEYKAFIHSEFGGEVTVNGDEAIYRGSFPSHIRDSSNEVTLGNKTHDFMKQFKYQTMFNLTQDQIDILRDKSADLAHKRLNEHDYLVAVKLKDMAELKRTMFHRHKLCPSTEQLQPLMQRHSIQSNFSRSSSTLSLNSDISENLSQRSSIGYNLSTYTIYSLEQVIMFSIERFEDRLRQYLNGTFHVKLVFERKYFNEKTKGTKPCISIKMTGSENETQNATDELNNLFSSKQTKRFDEETDGTWTNVIDAIEVINYHFKLIDLTCICEQASPGVVIVHYFDIANPQFGIDEQQIDDIVRDKFQSAVVNFTLQTSDSIFNKEWGDLQEKLLKRNDYNKKICFATQSNMIYLFGLPELVKEYREKFEQLKNKHEPQPYKITLTDKQLIYLKTVAKGDLSKLEKRYKPNGCDISLVRLRQHGEFIAPPDLHSKIKDSLDELTKIEEISFEVTEQGFDILVSKDLERLYHIAKPKCYLEKSIEICREHIPIPTARIADLDDGVNQKSTIASSASSRVTSVTIGHSTVTICIGDLTAQAVDAIVICSSSQYLCKAIVEKAGSAVVKEYATLRSKEEFPSTATAGVLPCKKIFFIPWSADSHDDDDIKTSLSTFIATAFLFTNSDGYKSIAFPAVGCGGFNFAPLTIAKYMLHEIREQLRVSKQKMNISLVLLANQQDVYDAFIQRLNELVAIDINVNQKSPSKIKQDKSTIPYDRKIVKITLISSTKDQLMKCKQEIINLARDFSVSTKLTNKRDMLDWSQKTIYKYYEFCLKQHVIPTLDLDNVILELVGTKDAVHEAEKYFYELTNETLKQERIHAMSRGVIWSVELLPNSDTWEQYSFKLNGIIEDAYLKHRTEIEIYNDKDEKCRIVFATMLEHGLQIRRVRRKPVNSILPSTWDPSDHNCKRVTLSSTSSEYQNILSQFHITMLGKYSQIFKIERIQNERWFKQYDAHREDFKRRYEKLDERQLFHGCTGTATSQIIENCFNRSFAGVNGNLFGFGVYFHAQASYSHNYAYANSAGERTMFLASVLIGKTCKGDKDMKTAPTGYDTTTDGQHIFVVYHDAGVYADYLITYK
ncbi:hypothetical protein I4U23_001769 [Adineta vaga]|nr:hypothetical protein I4U23_001769 [Adineta vaga]